MWCPRALVAPGFVRESGRVSARPPRLLDRARKGVFTIWEQEGVFARVKLGPHGQIEWPDDVELCPDAIYLKLTGKRPEDVFTGPGPNLHA